MKWATGILRAVGLGGDRTGEEEAKAAAAKEERRRTFGKLYEHMGHHGAVVSSTVLDNAQFDLHKVPSKPVTVDAADYPIPQRPKFLIDEAEEKARRQSMEQFRRGSMDSAAARERRDRFVRDFSGVSADASARDLLGESSLETELAFSKYADKPIAQPQPPLPPPGLRFPVIEQRQSMEGMRVASEKYTKARDHFVEMMDPVLSVH
jgi:hypothetical protein